MLMSVLQFLGNDNWAIFVIVMLVFELLILLALFIYVRDKKRRWNKLNDYLGDVAKMVNSVRYGDLSKKIENLDFPDSEDLSESLNRMIDTLHDRENMVVEYQTELVHQNRMLEKIIDSLSDGLIITDENDKILRATELVAEWFGVSGKHLVGKDLYSYIQLEHKKPVQYLDGDEVVLPSQKDLNFTASAVPLNLEDKKPRYIVILKNITGQKEVDTLKEDFVATLTHDLKVPIIAETNMLELFLGEKFGKISDKQKLALVNMQASNKELLELVQIVLDTYKVGKILLYKENILLKGFIDEVISEMGPIGAKTGNKIIFEPNRDIRVFADRFQLRRVIKNLIQNAISYGEPKSPIEITIGEIPDYVTVKVKDHGAGIPKTEIGKIFNKFYSASKKFRKIGTGLGLYLSLQIMKAHNGDLTVESEEGEYTEFCVKIPAIDYEPRFM